MCALPVITFPTPPYDAGVQASAVEPLASAKQTEHRATGTHQEATYAAAVSALEEKMLCGWASSCQRRAASGLVRCGVLVAALQGLDMIDVPG
ncbi:hypothetical protein PC123_g12888 [Phytophthora cactorum]|nr:hypothetical protein PC123_g12888 [Phytophthora cactorum]